MDSLNPLSPIVTGLDQIHHNMRLTLAGCLVCSGLIFASAVFLLTDTAIWAIAIIAGLLLGLNGFCLILLRRSSQTCLISALNAVHDPLIVISDQGVIKTFNATAGTVLGLARAWPRTRHIGDVLVIQNGSEDPVAATANIIQKSADKSRDTDQRVFANDLEGDLIPVDVFVTPITESRGSGDLYIFHLRNVSMPQDSAHNFHGAREKSDTSEKAQSRFLGMISHEMRTPLNGILGTLDLMEDTPLTYEQQRYNRVMQTGAQQLLAQINDALDLAQMGAGHISLQSEPFDLDAMLHEVVATQSPMAEKQGTNLRLNVRDGPIGLVLGDRTRVLQIMINLVSNAVKFTSKGVVSLDVARSTSCALRVEFQVADNGVGIKQNDLPRIFDDFVQVGDPAQAALPGTGLGLGIVRELVTLMDGQVSAESVLGQGSLFSVILPLPTCPEMQLESDSRAHAHAPQTPLKILVVDDNDTNRFVICEMLRKDGHLVTDTSDGASALDAAAQTHFELIFMDIRMPLMDGIETARLIREAPWPSAAARLVFLSAHVQPEDSKRISNLGAEAIRSKPLRRVELRAIVAKLTFPVWSSVQGAEALEHSINTIDARVLAQLQEMFSTFEFNALLAQFEAEGDAFVTDLASLLKAPQANVAAQIHSFAGSAATFGALALQARLVVMEDALLSGRTPEFEKFAYTLPSLWALTRDALQKERSVARSDN